jgi:hypothetical protein
VILPSLPPIVVALTAVPVTVTVTPEQGSGCGVSPPPFPQANTKKTILMMAAYARKEKIFFTYAGFVFSIAAF